MKYLIDMRDKIEKPPCEHCFCLETGANPIGIGATVKDHWQCCNCGIKKKKAGYLNL